MQGAKSRALHYFGREKTGNDAAFSENRWSTKTVNDMLKVEKEVNE
jgi:hypothetical protein